MLNKFVFGRFVFHSDKGNLNHSQAALDAGSKLSTALSRILWLPESEGKKKLKKEISVADENQES